METEEIRIDCKPVGKNGKVALTAYLPDGTKHTHKLDVTNSTARGRFVDRLCSGRDGIDRDTVEQRLEDLAAESVERAENPAVETGTPPAPEALLESMPPAVRAEAESLLNDKMLIKHVINDAEALGVAGEQKLAATIYLTGVSRLLDGPLAIIVQGPSASGKSYVIEQVARMFPPEAVIQATQMTPKALFHMKPGALKHRFIVAGERSRVEDDDAAEATRALREMLSSGRLSKLMPVKSGNDIQTVLIEQNGPIAYVESTTVSKVFNEDANRCVILHTDERERQTRRIITRLAKGYAGERVGETPEEIIQRHHAIQRMLRGTPVLIPYATRVAELFKADQVQVRRAFPQLMSMVKAVATLYQRQRQTDAEGRLVATVDDYQLARYLLLKPMTRLLGGGLSDPAGRFFERLLRWVVGEFTTREAVAKEDGCKSAVYGWLSELHDNGLVEMVNPSRGRVPATWRVSGSRPEDPAEMSLPSVEQVFPDISRKHGLKLETVVQQ